MDGPVNEQWWMLTIADPDHTAIFGDFVVHLTGEGRTAEIGYTLACEAWGHGYAPEAAEALVEYLFETVGVTRVEAMLHPDNTASAMVLERTGLLWEGHTRPVVLARRRELRRLGLRDDPARLGGMDATGRPTADERTADRDDGRQPDGGAPLCVTHKSQERFVSPVIDSFADALFPEMIAGAPVVPWMRAIEADGELAGFVMLAITTEAHPEPYLWRLPSIGCTNVAASGPP